MNGASLNEVTVAGGALAFRERGAGAPVVFVHGDLSDLRTWSPQLESIGRSYRAIAYSRRNAWPNDGFEHGGSGRLDEHVADLEALLGALDAVPAHLVGNSSGAFACLLLAMRRPDLVRTLTLAEPPVMTLFLSPRPRPGELLRLAVRRPRLAAAIARFGASTMGPAEASFRRGEDEAAMLRFVDGVLGRERFAALPDARRRQARDNVAGLRATLTGDGLPPLEADAVRRVSAPVLLVAGEHSPPLFGRLTAALGELLPGAERVEVAAASHVMHEENPAAFDAALLGFLARAGAGAHAPRPASLRR